MTLYSVTYLSPLFCMMMDHPRCMSGMTRASKRISVPKASLIDRNQQHLHNGH